MPRPELIHTENSLCCKAKGTAGIFASTLLASIAHHDSKSVQPVLEIEILAQVSREDLELSGSRAANQPF